MKAFVIGWPIEHSLSPVMHNAAFAALGIDARMEPRAVKPEELATFVDELRAPDVLGASVTVPHKVAIMERCDEVTHTAREIGAVNCLHVASGRVIGHNTDAAGFHDAMIAAGFTIAGTHAVLLGAGGASRAVEHALQFGGATTEKVRRPWTVAQLRDSFARADLLVDCTSAGLDAASDVEFTDALPLDALPPRAWVATLIYHRRTRLLELAAARGLHTHDGRGMLARQAAHAFGLWTRREPPIDIMTRALDDALVKSA